MRQYIAIVAGLFIGGAVGLSSVAEASVVTDGVAAAAGKSKTKRKAAPKDKAEEAPKDQHVEDPTGGGGATLTVTCWCSGGANGNGYASCLGDSCDSANTCCSDAYGEGSTASD